MKNFKKFTLGLLGTILLTTGLYSCSNDDATLTDNVTTEQIAKNAKSSIPNSEIINYNYEEIGIVHNQALEYVYNQLVANAPFEESYIMSQSQDFLIESINEFVETTSFGSKPSRISIIQNYTLSNEDFLLVDLRKNYFPGLEEYKVGLSNSALNIVNQIENELDLFEQGTFPIMELENNLRGKVSNLNNLLETENISQNEYVMLRTSLSVAIYSAQYWHNNLNSWVDLATLGGVNQPSSWFGRWWRKTVKTDVHGAASGWRGSENEGGERMGDALDAGISSSAEAGLVMLIDLIGGHDSTVD